MVKLNKIYTRTGDDGTTGLVRGPRRPKHDLRIDAYGSIEEANAFIGLARTAPQIPSDLDTVLARIQNDLFDAGSDLATPGQDGSNDQTLRITPKQITWLETTIDHYNADLQPLTSFILPGGSLLATHLHLARTITRRAERIATALIEAEPDTGPLPMQYLNRLSDLLFVLARVANDGGTKDTLWTPGQYGGQSKPEKAGK